MIFQKKNLKHVFFRFFPLKKLPLVAPEMVLGGPSAQVLANWCAHKGYPRLKDEEEVRRRRKLARRGLGKTEKTTKVGMEKNRHLKVKT
jgi:hypothetical protein